MYLFINLSMRSLYDWSSRYDLKRGQICVFPTSKRCLIDQTGLHTDPQLKYLSLQVNVLKKPLANYYYSLLHLVIANCISLWFDAQYRDVINVRYDIWNFLCVWFCILLTIATSCILMRYRASSPFITILHHHIASSHCFSRMIASYSAGREIDLGLIRSLACHSR